MTPSELIDDLAAAYYERFHEGDGSPIWELLPDNLRERHRQAVRSLLRRHMDISEPPRDRCVVARTPTGEGAPISWVKDAAADRVPVIVRRLG